jgi:tetratricopeptide (TPR) repeat protein
MSREDARLQAASRAFRHARYEEAIKAAQACAKVYPLEALWLIGMSACRQKQHDLAKETLAKLEALKSPDAAASSAEIKRECSRTDVEKKLAELADAQRPISSTKDVEELYRAGNFRLARALAEVYLDTDPEVAWSYIGKSSCGMKDLERANTAVKHLASDAVKLAALKAACEKFKVFCRDGQCTAK